MADRERWRNVRRGPGYRGSSEGRVRSVDRELTDGRSVEQTERDLKRLFPREHWNRLHLRLIFYGREHCTARGCDGTVCEICRTLFPNRRRAVATRK